MSTTQLIGIGASVFTATSLLPQLYKLCKEKQGQDMSIFTLLILFVGLSLWTWYGYLIKDWILVCSNAFSLIVNIAITVLSFKYKNQSS
ncbi:MAG: SemiSWEET family transporter [Bacteroidota bacterium]